MMGGKAAAATLLDMRATGDFSKASCAVYQRRWLSAYGHDFPMSTKFAELIYRCARTRRSTQALVPRASAACAAGAART